MREGAPRLRILGIGDNVVDQYLDLGLMFPGGNALNVPVLARRYGAEAAYIGVLGNDRAGQHILASLRAEDVDVSRVQFVARPNRYARVTLVEGDRVFLPGGNKDVTGLLTLSATDYHFMRNFDVVHSSVHSLIEDDLPTIRKHSRHVSFDFSRVFDRPILDRILPYVDFAFFSGAGMSLAEIQEAQREIAHKGPRFVLVTRGPEGTVLYLDDAYVEQPPVLATIVDTLGAGDAFIARFLVGFLEGEEVSVAMRSAAEAAAATCGKYGAFGYGIPLELHPA
jgi:fructoselysine 6-kinase